MKRYNKLYESHPRFEILHIAKYLKKTFGMDFVVIGGGAYSIYTGDRSSDLDIVVYDYGSLNEKEIDRVIAKTKDGKLLKIEQFGVEIDLLIPGQKYVKDGELLFKIPKKFKNPTNMEGVKIANLNDLMNMFKKKNAIKRYQHLIKIFNLSKNYSKNIIPKLRKSYLDAYILVKGDE